ncbi:MAG: OsmC family protein [Dehalococcoidia bacterium]
MYGTLAGALSARKVRFDRSRYEATVEGKIEGIGRTIRITEIVVHYKLAIPAGTREETDRALRVHPEGCPAHQSVKDAIRISYDAEIEEFEPRP